MSRYSHYHTARAFTIWELLVTVSMMLLIVLVVAPGPMQMKARYAQPITCMDNMNRISRAVAMCYRDYNGYGPSADDGACTSFMFTWADALYDLDYLTNIADQWCPADEHPDYVAEERGTEWCFYFVDHFGVREPIKRGTRTSYAINRLMSLNFKQDRFEDASRQVYAMDGWWSWHANLNAAWVLYEEVMGEPPPELPDDLSWRGAMHGWRHGLDHSANVLYCDGHVSLLTPNVPEDLEGLLNDTVDTMESFTWLPGERNMRGSGSVYQGSVEEYIGLQPFFVEPDEGTYRMLNAGNEAVVPIDYPAELNCGWRTLNQAWRTLPNDLRMRR